MLRFELPENKRLVHEMVIPIRWGDMDAFSHVNNTVYFRFMESLRIEWFGTVVGVVSGEHGPVVVNAFCNFLRQLTFPGEVRCRLYVSQIGRSSLDTYVTMARTDDPGTVYAEGGARIVWVNYAKQQSVPLPEAVRAAASER
jgi:acyl-CoA thioester hydrolase